MAQISSNKCDICEEAIGKVFCYECQHFLCQTCQTWHEKFPSTKRHTVADSSHIDRSVFNTKLVCEKHNQEYIHYCQNCACLTCAICATADHRSHSFTNVSEMTSSLRQDVKKKVDDATTQLKQLTGLIDYIRSVQLHQVEDDKDKFTRKVRVLSEVIYNIVDFVTDVHITRANDFLVLQQQNLKHDLAKAEKLYKDYSSVIAKLEGSLYETHDMTFFVQHKPLKKEYGDLDDIPKPEVPQRLEEFKQEDFTTLVIDKMNEKYDLSLIRSLKAKDEEIQQLKEERKKTKTLIMSKDLEIRNLREKLERKESTASAGEAKPSNRIIEVCVKSMLTEGKRLVISLHANDTVKKFKQLIYDKTAVSLDQQLLRIAGTGKSLLREELTISDYGIQNGTTIELGLHLRNSSST